MSNRLFYEAGIVGEVKVISGVKQYVKLVVLTLR